MKTPYLVVHKISFFISAFRHTYLSQYQIKRRELTKLQDSNTHTSTINKATLQSLVRELSDHTSIVPPTKQQAHLITTQDTSGSGNNSKRKASYQSQYSENDRCQRQCSYYKKVLNRLGHGHTEDTCNIKSGKQKASTSNIDSNLPASDYIPQRRLDREDSNKRYVTIYDVKTKGGDTKKKKLVGIARVFSTKHSNHLKHDQQFDTTASIYVYNERASFRIFDNNKDNLPQVSNSQRISYAIRERYHNY